jgi:hypothetical protein
LYGTFPVTGIFDPGILVAKQMTMAINARQLAPLLGQIDGRIARVTVDSAYDGTPTYQTIQTHGDRIEAVIPPRSTAVASGELNPPTQRDRQLEMITERGRLALQVATNYSQRSPIETTMGRHKTLIGPRLRAPGFAAQQTEAAAGVAVLNRMPVTGRPKSVRCQRVIAKRPGAGVISPSIRQVHQRLEKASSLCPAYR